MRKHLMHGSIVVVFAFGVFWFGGHLAKTKANMSSNPIQFASLVTGLPDLLALPVAELNHVDITRMNLFCAQGLPGAGDLNVSNCLATLQAMADRVRSETARNHYRFETNPANFENSESFYKMVVLAVVLAEDFQVKYAPGKMVAVADAHTDDGFFADAHDVFLHGLLGTRREGTCSSLPVLQVAVGRQLGYPLKLVTTKGHLFVRWEGAQERFNVEAAGNGVNRFPDDYYRHWPLEVSAAEVQAEGYLKSLTSAEELAVFMSIRGMCWRDARRYADAAESFQAASRLATNCQSYRSMALEMQIKR